MTYPNAASAAGSAPMAADATSTRAGRLQGRANRERRAAGTQPVVQLEISGFGSPWTWDAAGVVFHSE